MRRRKPVWLALFCILPLFAKGGLSLNAMAPAARETALRR